jgi:hypothetical protein
MAFASAAKAKAIVDAINGAKLNGVSAAVDDKKVPGGLYPTGETMPQVVRNRFGQFVTVQVPKTAPADFTSLTAKGVRQSIINSGTPGAKLGPAIHRTPGIKNTTGEIGNGKFTFIPGSGSINAGNMFQGTFSGNGAGTGLSTGIDFSGYQSVVGFGFIDETSSTPVDYIAAFDPPSGLIGADVLGILANLFNEDFSTDGYTATYDPTTDTLSIDQLLPAVDMLWSANSDTGLDLESSTSSVPEPSPLPLLAIAMIALSILSCRQRIVCRPVNKWW